MCPQCSSVILLPLTKLLKCKNYLMLLVLVIVSKLLYMLNIPLLWLSQYIILPEVTTCTCSHCSSVPHPYTTMQSCMTFASTYSLIRCRQEDSSLKSFLPSTSVTNMPSGECVT